MIDWTRIDTLRDEIGADCLQEVVDLFLEEVDATVAQLRGSDPVDDLGAQLHFLKGCALNLGFSDFAALCQRGEADCAQDSGAQIDLGALLACYDRSRAAFHDGFSAQCA